MPTTAHSATSPVPSPSPPHFSRCRHGYWNAIAFGAAAIWGLYAALVIVDDGSRLGTFECPIETTTLYEIFEYVNGPAWLFPETLSEVLDIFVFRFWPLWGTAPFGTISYAMAITFIPGIQWLVFLGALRLYWWLRRAPVTRRSALEAIFAMAAIIALCRVLYTQGWGWHW